MKTRAAVILFFLFGCLSILSAMDVVTSRFLVLTVLFKFFFFLSSYVILKKLEIKSRPLLVLGIILLFPILLFGSGIFSKLAFFPTIGGYELKCIYYKTDNINILNQNRIEYFEKRYGINNTAEKFEKVTPFLGFLELREEIFFEEIVTRDYKKKYFNNYRPA